MRLLVLGRERVSNPIIVDEIHENVWSTNGGGLQEVGLGNLVQTYKYIDEAAYSFCASDGGEGR